MRDEIVLKGFGVCPGIAIGSPFIGASKLLENQPGNIEMQQVPAEIRRYRAALLQSETEIEEMRSEFLTDLVDESLALMESHLFLLRDPEWSHFVEEEIRRTCKNSEAAVITTVDRLRERFSRLDSTFRDRFSDIQDVSNRLLRHLGEQTPRKKDLLPKQAIYFSDEITTSDTFLAKRLGVIAFVCQKGGPACHAAIVARAQGIPYVVGIDLGEMPIGSLDRVIVDGEKGVVILNPTDDHLRTFQKRQKELKSYETRRHSRLFDKVFTADGIPITVNANIDYSDTIESDYLQAADGVGLFRSESIVMDRQLLPGEEEQFVIYRDLVSRLQPKPVVIRTFDLGGDKQLNSNRLVEDNPFLGCRATRLLLREKHLLRAQLRAILRASAYGNSRILFPMISAHEELIEVLSVLDDVKQELQESHIPFDQEIPVGCMIEVPSAALIVDKLAPHCQFFSIGTNDLIQYTMAVDRGNALLSHLYNPLNPAVLRLIHHVVQQAGIPVSVCGEMAADPRFLPYLLGLGIRSLSINPRQLPLIKEVIGQIYISKAIELVKGAL